MFDFFKKKADKADDCIYSPVKGKIIASSQVNDPTFAEEMLGKGFAVIPQDDEIFSPCDGEVALVFDTKHAISIRSSEGAEILIHMGLDTVKLAGKYFEVFVEAGSKVKKGDLIAKADFAKIKEEGYDTVIPIILLNTDSYGSVDVNTGFDALNGDEVMKLKK